MNKIGVAVVWFHGRFCRPVFVTVAWALLIAIGLVQVALVALAGQ